MSEVILLLAIAAFIVGMSKGGLASAGTLAVPLVALAMDPLTAAALLLPVYLVSDAVGVWLYRREYSLPNLKLLIPAGFVGVIIATLLEPVLPVALFTLATGLIGLSYLFRDWVLPRLRRSETPPAPMGRAAGMFWGTVTGITSFISHSGAPPFQTYVLPQRLPKMVFAGTTTICFAAINLAKVPAYWGLGLMNGLNWPLIGALSIAAIAGTFAGRWLSKILPDHIYLAAIKVFLLLLSIELTWKGLSGLL
ncbi:Sulfite exporter TauE/SafE [Aquimixticola soesokkakensis]|uniref:Probable membrane transporter protein n=1 Tax=Aquimixticola soesokkakensis TaxID=1519096 RepID=A0A1Y5T9V0_9RHOB|nr:sulfite exporter TauE/SafE family protein [Aquimixticola soesokkakensis]SLN59091.1 Sulfite exporter TauE/SafE [Aquimixticola soesokkakensis]